MSGRENLIEFIVKYKECECLWKVTDKDYRNKHKRSNALEQLIPVLRKTDVYANRDTVIKKINTLRSSFNKEHNKVIASYQSGVDIDEVHVPKLWYYDLLLFLTERDTESRRSNDIDPIQTETRADTPVGMDTYAGTGQDSPRSQSSAITSVSQQNTQDMIKNSKIKRKIRAISKRLGSSVSKSKPKFSAFGEHIAERLRTMPDDMASYCQKIINDAIFQGEFGTLNYTSRIDTVYPQHFLQHRSPTSTQVQSRYQSPSPSNKIQKTEE